MLAFPVLKWLREMHEDGQYLTSGDGEAPVFQQASSGTVVGATTSPGLQLWSRGPWWRSSPGFGAARCAPGSTHSSHSHRGNFAAAGRTNRAKDSQPPTPGMASREFSAQFLLGFHGWREAASDGQAGCSVRGCFSPITAGAVRCVYAWGGRITEEVGTRGKRGTVPKCKLVCNSK